MWHSVAGKDSNPIVETPSFTESRYIKVYITQETGALIGKKHLKR